MGKRAGMGWLMGLLWVGFALIGCKEDEPVVYSERVAILPDHSGLITKEIRSIDKTHTRMVLCESVGGHSRDLLSVPLDHFTDCKFKFQVQGDTVELFHTQAGLDQALQTLGKPTFPVRTIVVPAPTWISEGTLEGDPIFYQPDHWKAFLESTRKK